MKRLSKYVLMGVVVLAVVLAVALYWSVGFPSWKDFDRPPAGKKPVVLISIDTLRADRVGCYGDNRAETPVMDKLATVSHRFAQAHSPIPLTLPSHASMLTGLYPSHHGSHDNGRPILPSIRTLTEKLKKAGYYTAGFVSAQVMHGRYGLSRGFDVYDDKWDDADYAQGVVQRRCDQVNASVKRFLGTAKRQPLFLFVHYFDPHRDYRPPPPFSERFATDPYRGEVAFADHCTGQLLAMLGEHKLLDDAVVVVTSDHGEGLGDHDEITHGFFAYQSTQHVPLLIKLPNTSTDVLDNRFVSLVDIMPTVLRLVGLSVPDGLDGVDLFDKGIRDKRTLFAECGNARQWRAQPIAVAYRDPLKYIHTLRPELYDIRKDPKELNNLMPRHSSRAMPLKARLEAVGIYQAMLAPVPELDDGTTKMLSALGYLQSDQKPLTSEPARLDPKDIVEPYYRYIGQNGTLLYQRKLAPKERDLKLIAEVASLATAIPKELRHVQVLQKLPQEAEMLIADTLIALGRYEQAVERFRSLTQRQPKHPRAYHGLAVGLSQLGRHSEADKAFKQAIRFSKKPLPVQIDWAVALLKREDPSRAIELLAPLAKAHPRNDRLQSLYLVALERSQASTVARDHCRSILTAYPRSVPCSKLLQTSLTN